MELFTKENLSKLAYLAVGVVVQNENKIKETIDEWVKDGKVAQEEGEKFVDEMIAKTRDAKKELEEKVQAISEQWYEKAHIATTEQLKALEERVAALEAKK